MGSSRMGGSRLAALTTALALTAPGIAYGSASSLPRKEGTSPRPGPEVLYEPLAKSPQLENAPHSPWHAKPILISGASAYRTGEFLYQGYIYDDHGAKLTPDPTDPQTNSVENPEQGDLFSAPDGTYTYPTDTSVYRENAANLIELRVKPLTRATAFRTRLSREARIAAGPPKLPPSNTASPANRHKPSPTRR